MRWLALFVALVSPATPAGADEMAAKPSQVTAGTVVEAGPGGTWEVMTEAVAQSLGDREGRELHLAGGILRVKRWFGAGWIGGALPVVVAVSSPAFWDDARRNRGVGPGLLELGLRNRRGGVALTLPLPLATERVAELQSSLGAALFTGGDHGIAMLVVERLPSVAGGEMVARLEGGIRGRTGDRVAVAFTAGIGRRIEFVDGHERSAVTMGARLHLGIQLACAWSLRSAMLAEFATGGPSYTWGQRFSVSIGLARELRLGW
jgi:hypothetical protein